MATKAQLFKKIKELDPETKFKSDDSCTHSQLEEEYKRLKGVEEAEEAEYKMKSGAIITKNGIKTEKITVNDLSKEKIDELLEKGILV